MSPARRSLTTMCGRFAMDAHTDELVREFVADGGKPEDWWKSWHGSYSIAPTDDAVIVRDRGEGRILELVRWDWQKPANRPKGAPIINARMEKLAQGFWAPAFSAARCIVPMRGYYEWTGEKGDKTPHFLHGDGLLSEMVACYSPDHEAVFVRPNLHGVVERCAIAHEIVHFEHGDFGANDIQEERADRIAARRLLRPSRLDEFAGVTEDPGVVALELGVTEKIMRTYMRMIRQGRIARYA